MKTRALPLTIALYVLVIGCAPLPLDPAAGRSSPPLSPLLSAVSGELTSHVAVIGDMGTGGSGQHQVAAAMARRGRESAFDFVLTVGDNFYPSGVSTVEDPQWQSKFEEVYDDPALSVPFFAALGNHDHKGNVQAQIDYSHRSERWSMPAPYYAFQRLLGDGTRIAFFAIDTTALGIDGPARDEQLRWLSDSLAAAADARWRIVFGHHPIYSHSKTRRNPILQACLEPILIEGGVDLYLAGHDHVLEMHKPVEGVHHVISGGGAGPEKAYRVEWTDESFYAATLGGFVTLRIGRRRIAVEFIRLEGDVQYRHLIEHPSEVPDTR